MKAHQDIHFNQVSERLQRWIDTFKKYNDDLEPTKEDIKCLPRIEELFNEYQQLKNKRSKSSVPCSPSTRKFRNTIFSPSPKKIFFSPLKTNIVIPESPNIRIPHIPKTLFLAKKTTLFSSPKRTQMKSSSLKTLLKSETLSSTQSNRDVEKTIYLETLTPTKHVESFPESHSKLFTRRKKRISTKMSPTAIKYLCETSTQSASLPGNCSLGKLDFTFEPIPQQEPLNQPKRKSKKPRKQKLTKKGYVSENFVRMNLRRKTWRDKRKKKKFKNSGFHQSRDYNFLANKTAQ